MLLIVYRNRGQLQVEELELGICRHKAEVRLLMLKRIDPAAHFVLNAPTEFPYWYAATPSVN